MTTASSDPQDRGPSRIAGVLLLIGAALLWGASRMNWLSVDTFDDKAGPRTVTIAGAMWSTEATALALVLVAGGIAVFALRRWGRRIVGIISAVAAVGASWTPLTLLGGQPDPERAHRLLSAGSSGQRGSQQAAISSWAEIVNIDVLTAGPVVAMIGAALALVGGVLVAFKPGTDGPKLNRFERKSQRREKLAEDLRTQSDSGRVMWDALDEDIDPTDVDASR